MEGKFAVCADDDSNEMILPGLYGFFSDIPSMVVGRNELIRHAGVGDGLFVCCGCFVAEDLSRWDDTKGSHALKCTSAGKDEFRFVFVFGWFHPDGIAVDMI